MIERVTRAGATDPAQKLDAVRSGPRRQCRGLPMTSDNVLKVALGLPPTRAHRRPRIAGFARRAARGVMEFCLELSACAPRAVDQPKKLLTSARQDLSRPEVF
jgi:hypothetical protein